jgi:hypothetical protein
LLSGAPQRVLILTNFGQCHAQETAVSFFGARGFNN